MNEIEKTWNEEVREKKRTASGVHGKKGKRGYVGTMRTPVDLMADPKERRAYEGTTPVRASIHPTDDFITYEEFKKLSRQAKTMLLYKLRSKFSTKALSGAWGISENTIYYYYRAYGIKRDSIAPDLEEKASDGKPDSTFKPALRQTPQQSSQQVKTSPESDMITGPIGSSLNKDKENECCFTLLGTFAAESLSKKLSGLAFMLDDIKKYDIRLELRELEN